MMDRGPVNADVIAAAGTSTLSVSRIPQRPRVKMNPLHFAVRTSAALCSRWRNIWYRMLGVKMRGYVWMRRISIPRQWTAVTLEKGVCLDDGVVLLCTGIEKSDKLVVKCGTYINRYTMIDAHEHIEIGRHCMIGPHCYITDGNHGMAPEVEIQDQAMTAKRVVIEDGVWLGAGVTVLAGVRLRRGAVIGAGAVVTKDISANAVAVGVPAREVGLRKGSPTPETIPARTI